ncbi:MULTISPECIES: hypothetical protein [unclassified Campylobacter]|uniref:hypothetical protein n=1 Tax=unclassified Campylobacter TaxID=2593542 RepID=UPI0022E9C10B|nr:MULTISPECIES: hypothetical protein [unclassified Campylobacter]MDA3055724.1 hypothetical protein [Campylobacter sp. CN_NA1]MDA3065012.1 hypothetical protein [Campylobacter sp. CN_NE4]MDA3068580.1 hypothetical protein [Campylobacter sp. CN_NE3]MDA3082097.1 hypothetical protein [Campylobacter sp. CN_EL2]MDA3084165.1 hypothetical protein [Campylobacter sp. CN_NE1]
MECDKFYPYENSDDFYSLYKSSEFYVVCGVAEGQMPEDEKHSVGIHWCITKKGNPSKVGYPSKRYVRIPDIFAIDFLKSLLKNDKKHCDEVKINKVIKILEKQNLR